MKKFLAILLVVVMIAALVTGCASGKKGIVDEIKSRGKLIMLTNAGFPPFEFLGDDNKPAGVDVDVAGEIAKSLGVELEIVDMDFDGLINALASGKGDLIAAGMSVTEERKKSVDFSVEYVTSAQYCIIKEGSPIATMADLAGLRVGVQTGTTGDLILSDEVELEEGSLYNTGTTISRYKTALEAALDINNGRLDAVVIDKHPAMSIAAANDGLTTTAEAISEEEKYAIAINKGNEDLLKVVNEALEKMMKDGTIESFINKHTGVQ